MILIWMTLLGLRTVKRALEVGQQLFQPDDAIFLALNDAILVSHLCLRGHDNSLKRIDIVRKIWWESHRRLLPKPCLNRLRKTLPESFCRSWWAGLQSRHPPPVEARKQRFKLGWIKP